jgi:hypothetical protein
MTGQRTPISHGKGPRRGRRGRLLLLFTLMLAALIVSIAYFLLSPSVLGRFWEPRAKPTLRIENRTDDAILVYDVWVDGSEHRLSRVVPAIPPQTSVQTGLACAADELIARNDNGGLIVRRGPFRECNLEAWVIESPSGQ